MADDLDEDEAPGGEMVEFDSPVEDVEDTEDGGALVTIGEVDEPSSQEFLQNLAEVLPETVLDRLATDFVQKIERDADAREKRIKQYEDGIRRTGLGNDAPGGAQFEGASKVVHPMITEVCVDFSARVVKEINPPGGPVKSSIVGDVTKARVEKANRKSEFMNWQLTVQCPEFSSELEQMETQLPLGGSQYLKITWDSRRNGPRFEFVPIDDMFLPYAATNFVMAQRKTHRQLITQVEYEERVRQGMYRDVDLVAPSLTPEGSIASQANDKIEGRTQDPYNDDGLREVYEIEALVAIDEDPDADGVAPYVITVDKTSNKVLAVYRNWDEDDPTETELQWIVEFPFIPWRGAYGIGISHMISTLSGAATGALRALLDSAHIANSPSGLKLKGSTSGGQSITAQPTEIAEVEGNIATDDIRKLFMPFPFAGPNGTLFQLLGFLVDAGKNVVRTTMQDMVDTDTNVPVGTQMARLEQGLAVFSSIFQRQHHAMQRVLAVVHRLNGQYLDDDEVVRQTGSQLASRADFQGPMDVVPVSDPNIFSEAQRYAQTQAVAQRAALNPMLYNLRKVEERILQTLKIPNPTELLAPGVEPKEENAVSENVKASLGRPIVAFPQQDHIAHLQTHLAYMQSPVFGSSQLIGPTFLPVMLKHVSEHIALWYAQEVFETANEVTDQPLSEMLPKTKTPEAKRALDQLVAQAALDVTAGAPDILGKLNPVIAQAIELMQKLMPPPPADPATQVAREDVAMRGKTAADKNATEQAKLQLKAQESAQEQAAEAAREEMRIAAENERTQAEIEARLVANREDNETAEELALLNLQAQSEARVSQDPDPNP